MKCVARYSQPSGKKTTLTAPSSAKQCTLTATSSQKRSTPAANSRGKKITASAPSTAKKGIPFSAKKSPPKETTGKDRHSYCNYFPLKKKHCCCKNCFKQT